jgi:hypothetical protein
LLLVITRRPKRQKNRAKTPRGKKRRRGGGGSHIFLNEPRWILKKFFIAVFLQLNELPLLQNAQNPKKRDKNRGEIEIKCKYKRSKKLLFFLAAANDFK